MKIVLVEHFVNDAEAWQKVMGGHFATFGQPGMSIDKAQKLPVFEGQSCLLTCPTSTNMTLCVWQQGDLSEDEFQAFIDRFTQGLCTNKCYYISDSLGLSGLTPRGYMRDFINTASEGKSSAGYLDAPKLWFVHHSIVDPAKFQNRMGEFVGIAASSENGDDLKTKFAASFGVPLGTYACASLFTEGADAACMWSSGEDVSIEDFQKYVDSFTTSACKNTVYAVDTGMSCNVMGLSEDLFLTEQIAWAKAAVATPTEEALAKKKAHLIECGLPEAQAAISVATDLPGGFKETTPSSCFYTHVIKPDGNVDEALKWFAEYTKAAKNSKGHSLVSHTYNPETREIIAIDVISGPNAMDNHIGNCFPAYAKMIGAGVEMKECVAIVPADEVEWWTNSLKVWGASRFIVKTDHTSVVVPTKEALEKKKAHLIECGLPEAQAAISVATDLPGGFKETTPSSCFYTHVIKPDGNVDEALKWFAEYTKAAKNSKGHSLVSHTYNPETREIIAIDIISGPNAMDNHIGNCFPAYAKMIGAGVEMKECVAIVPADEVEWWTNSLKVWGASRFIVKTDHVNDVSLNATIATPTEEALAKKKAHLIECGLPEAQAAISVATDLPGGFKETNPSPCFYTHVIKPEGNVDEALKWFAEYTKAAKNSKGHSLVSHTYNPETREIIAIDVISGPNAMDNHIGNCFPAYAKMIGAGVEMKECVAIVPADEVEWWTNSLKVWGASRFIVKTDHTKVEAVKTVETGIDATKYAMDVSQ